MNRYVHILRVLKRSKYAKNGQVMKGAGLHSFICVVPIRSDAFEERQLCEDVWAAENGQIRYITEVNGPTLV